MLNACKLDVVGVLALSRRFDLSQPRSKHQSRSPKFRRWGVLKQNKCMEPRWSRKRLGAECKTPQVMLVTEYGLLSSAVDFTHSPFAFLARISGPQHFWIEWFPIQQLYRVEFFSVEQLKPRLGRNQSFFSPLTSFPAFASTSFRFNSNPFPIL